MLKVWISGANGHLGQALCTRLDREKYQLIATDVAEVDVTVPAEVRAFADANRPDVIINCTGFNDEDGCETDHDRAYRVNALAPRNLALAADALGAKMVQFSTDDVFAKASHHPYNEFDAPAPESLYGKSKLAGEDHDTLGIYHIVCQGRCSRYDFAQAILEAAHMEDKLELHPIRAADAGSTPSYTVLDNLMLRLDNLPQPRPWKEALNEYINSLQ